ncbi:MAG TPA: GNAT family N-acetyltransferase [Roseiflexaceae bacterium]
MMNDLVLREATEDDLPIIVAIIRAAFAEYEGPPSPPSGVYRDSGERVLKKMESGRAALALLDGEPVGCAVYEPSEGYVYFGRLAVLPSYRHHKIGAALVSYVEERGRQIGMQYVRLGVRSGLPQLREWYELAGYALVEECFMPGFDEPIYVMLEKDVSR